MGLVRQWHEELEYQDRIVTEERIVRGNATNLRHVPLESLPFREGSERIANPERVTTSREDELLELFGPVGAE
jgi:hypothetical protein